MPTIELFGCVLAIGIAISLIMFLLHLLIALRNAADNEQLEKAKRYEPDELAEKPKRQITHFVLADDGEIVEVITDD